MDTPYRLLQLVRDVAEVMGQQRKMCVAFDLTLPSEEIFRGTAGDLFQEFSRSPKKGEFVAVLDAG
jgi:16S rRNA (cytidine1402-2'-O)-methyltransferase